MRRSGLALGGALLACSWAVGASAGVIDPGLSEILNATQPNEAVSTLVFLKDQADVDGIRDHMRRILADRQLQHRIVVESLQAVAQRSQGSLLHYLDGLAEQGQVDYYQAYWITNVIRVDAEPQEITAIAGRDDVDTVYFNYGIELIKPVEVVGPPNYTDGPEPGIVIIGAKRVWDELGITGEGTLVANIDTGVDGNHPALRTRWRGVADPRYNGHPEWAWLDPWDTHYPTPRDDHGHGTHTMGTVTGDDLGGNQIGVAPGAQWIAAGAIDRGGGIPRTVEDAIKSFQWMADPDGNPNTNFDVPDSCSNSWGVTQGHGFPPCDQTFWQWVDNSEAAGTVQLFSAGNEGNGGLRRPADRATNEYDSCAVAACDGNNPDCPLAGFSSRGPTNCTPNGQPAIKPDITAPGVNVRSSLPGGGYGSLSGTSMASPHINGVVALMREANPDAASEDIKQTMYDTATDKGAPGDDNGFGYGLVDAYEAVVNIMANPEPQACCFNDGSCEDLLRTDCLDRGGKSRFGETCGSFQCPQPGACCIDDATCEITLESDCLSRGGDFKGEGAGCNLACPCDLIKTMNVSCRGSGTIKAAVKLKNKSRDGETLKIQVGDRLRFDVPIRGKKAVLYTCCFNGPQQITLLEPEDCFDPKVVDCPE